MVIIFYLRNGHPRYSDDSNFIRKLYAAIKSEMIACLAQEKQGRKSVTLLPNTARGEYDNGGDVSGNYHIYFTAYADDNPERTLTELFFPMIPLYLVVSSQPLCDRERQRQRYPIG